MALAAGPSAEGSWTAIVGIPDLGLSAVRATGVELARTAFVPDVPRGGWAMVVAAFIDAFDVVIVEPDHRPGAADLRRLRARTRERGAVLIDIAGRHLDADIRLTVTKSCWEGLGRGHGHLRARRVVVTSSGRGAASRSRRVELWLPGPDAPVVAVSGVADMDNWRQREVHRGDPYASGAVS